MKKGEHRVPPSNGYQGIQNSGQTAGMVSMNSNYGPVNFGFSSQSNSKVSPMSKYSAMSPNLPKSSLIRNRGKENFQEKSIYVDKSPKISRNRSNNQLTNGNPSNFSNSKPKKITTRSIFNPSCYNPHIDNRVKKSHILSYRAQRCSTEKVVVTDTKYSLVKKDRIIERIGNFNHRHPVCDPVYFTNIIMKHDIRSSTDLLKHLRNDSRWSNVRIGEETLEQYGFNRDDFSNLQKKEIQKVLQQSVDKSLAILKNHQVRIPYTKSNISNNAENEEKEAQKEEFKFKIFKTQIAKSKEDGKIFDEGGNQGKEQARVEEGIAQPVVYDKVNPVLANSIVPQGKKVAGKDSNGHVLVSADFNDWIDKGYFHLIENGIHLKNYLSQINEVTENNSLRTVTPKTSKIKDGDFAAFLKRTFSNEKTHHTSTYPHTSVNISKNQIGSVGNFSLGTSSVKQNMSLLPVFGSQNKVNGEIGLLSSNKRKLEKSITIMSSKDDKQSALNFLGSAVINFNSLIPTDIIREEDERTSQEVTSRHSSVRRAHFTSNDKTSNFSSPQDPKMVKTQSNFFNQIEPIQVPNENIWESLESSSSQHFSNQSHLQPPRSQNYSIESPQKLNQAANNSPVKLCTKIEEGNTMLNVECSHFIYIPQSEKKSQPQSEKKDKQVEAYLVAPVGHKKSMENKEVQYISPYVTSQVIETILKSGEFPKGSLSSDSNLIVGVRKSEEIPNTYEINVQIDSSNIPEQDKDWIQLNQFNADFSSDKKFTDFNQSVKVNSQKSKNSGRTAEAENEIQEFTDFVNSNTKLDPSAFDEEDNLSNKSIKEEVIEPINYPTVQDQIFKNSRDYLKTIQEETSSMCTSKKNPSNREDNPSINSRVGNLNEFKGEDLNKKTAVNQSSPNPLKYRENGSSEGLTVNLEKTKSHGNLTQKLGFKEIGNLNESLKDSAAEIENHVNNDQVHIQETNPASKKEDIDTAPPNLSRKSKYEPNFETIHECSMESEIKSSSLRSSFEKQLSKQNYMKGSDSDISDLERKERDSKKERGERSSMEIGEEHPFSPRNFVSHISSDGNKTGMEIEDIIERSMKKSKPIGRQEMIIEMENESTSKSMIDLTQDANEPNMEEKDDSEVIIDYNVDEFPSDEGNLYENGDSMLLQQVSIEKKIKVSTVGTERPDRSSILESFARNNHSVKEEVGFEDSSCEFNEISNFTSKESELKGFSAKNSKKNFSGTKGKKRSTFMKDVKKVFKEDKRETLKAGKKGRDKSRTKKSRERSKIRGDKSARKRNKSKMLKAEKSRSKKKLNKKQEEQMIERLVGRSKTSYQLKNPRKSYLERSGRSRTPARTVKNKSKSPIRNKSKVTKRNKSIIKGSRKSRSPAKSKLSQKTQVKGSKKHRRRPKHIINGGKSFKSELQKNQKSSRRSTISEYLRKDERVPFMPKINKKSKKIAKKVKEKKLRKVLNTQRNSIGNHPEYEMIKNSLKAQMDQAASSRTSTIKRKEIKDEFTQEQENMLRDQILNEFIASLCDTGILNEEDCADENYFIDNEAILISYQELVAICDSMGFLSLGFICKSAVYKEENDLLEVMWYILGGDNSGAVNIHDLSVFILAIFGLGLGCIMEEEDEDQIFDDSEVHEIQTAFELFYLNKIQKQQREEEEGITTTEQEDEEFDPRLQFNQTTGPVAQMGELMHPEDTNTYGEIEMKKAFQQYQQRPNDQTMRYGQQQLLLNTEELMEYPCELPYEESNRLENQFTERHNRFEEMNLQNGIQPIHEEYEMDLASKKSPSTLKTAYSQNTADKRIEPFLRQTDTKSSKSVITYSNMDNPTAGQPILLLDINLPNGQIERVMLHEGDDPEIIVEQFAIEKNLDESTKEKFYQLLKAQIED